jgi:hypothetical protein
VDNDGNEYHNYYKAAMNSEDVYPQGTNDDNSLNKADENVRGAFISGEGNTAKSDGQFLMGKYTDVDEDTLLAYGDGTSVGDRQNVFEYKKVVDGEKTKSMKVEHHITSVDSNSYGTKLPSPIAEGQIFYLLQEDT